MGIFSGVQDESGKVEKVSTEGIFDHFNKFWDATKAEYNNLGRNVKEADYLAVGKEKLDLSYEEAENAII